MRGELSSTIALLLIHTYVGESLPRIRLRREFLVTDEIIPLNKRPSFKTPRAKVTSVFRRSSNGGKSQRRPMSTPHTFYSRPDRFP